MPEERRPHGGPAGSPARGPLAGAARRACGTVLAAFSMFSAIPVPQAPWTPGTMRYLLCAFPLVGAAVGGAEWACWAACGALGAGPLVRGALLTALPALLTGGIHLDGYCDTCDALGSHAPAARKQEILRDPRLGSSGAVRLGLYLLASLALWAELPAFPGPAVLMGFMLSRSLSGLAVASLEVSPSSGLARSFAEAADRRRVRAALAALSACLAALMCASAGWAGAAMAAAACAAFGWLARTARKEFAGLSGDLNGWFLQKAELWMLAALYAAGLLGLAG